ncbi:Sensor histidine kinase YehU [Clostridium liquoris]|jgi:two-component system sensor histidine kinase YesM|uniref:Sensor histidine kinase YehU n=1 Tax=Clostridium liquoris TaxID=1289519 RepID=A0A2T0B5T5_9CLOT|nr:sensor histidine kinase [Clostridium liquoris]PRR79163.1 Sensor histidine kinase YehU [Clostridium liquoris]
MIKNKSMSKKFISSFIILIVIPFFIITIVINSLYEGVLVSHYNEKIEQIMVQLSSDIEIELRRIHLYTAKVSNEQELLPLVNSWYHEKDSIKKLETYEKIETKLDYLFAYQGEINSIVFFSKNGEVFKYKDPLYKNDSDVKKSSLYKECMGNKGKVLSINNFNSSNDVNAGRIDFLVGVSPEYNWYNSDTEFIYFEIKTDLLNSIYSRFTNDTVGKMIIADSKGNIVISPDKNLLGKNISEVKYLNKISNKNNDYAPYKYRYKKDIKYISKYTSDKSGWTVINIIDYKALTKDTTNITKVLLMIFLIFNLLFILYSKMFFKDIIKPIKELVETMKGVKDEKLEKITITNTNLEEINELGSSYNKMINDIKDLIAERDLKERERSKEEIKALQAQINPHFIYNTLNVIKLMAMISKAENIRKVTDSFMKLLRATFRSKSTFITVREELEYLDNYTDIMKVRFGDNFNIVVNVQDNVKDLYIIKLILQPIVENAIIHGINDIDREKYITISGFLENGKLIFQVEDNGIGMTEDEIKNVLNNKENDKTGFNHIGINNVRSRIKLNCGQEYGLKIESEKNKFTRVTLIHPILTEEER